MVPCWEVGKASVWQVHFSTCSCPFLWSSRGSFSTLCCAHPRHLPFCLPGEIPSPGLIFQPSTVPCPPFPACCTPGQDFAWPSALAPVPAWLLVVQDWSTLQFSFLHTSQCSIPLQESGLDHVTPVFPEPQRSQAHFVPSLTDLITAPDISCPLRFLASDTLWK